MDSFELNKILGAILGTLLFVMGVGFVAEAIYAPAHNPGPGFDLPAPDEQASGDTGTNEPVKVADIGTLLAAADPKAGEASAKKCASCHDFTSGGPNKAGPNLYDVVERGIASHPGFAYSEALKGKSGETWTYENLNAWLTSPKAYAPGTKMTYAGDKDDADRANIIAYLASLSASPKPFPAPAAPEASGDASSAAPAEPSSSEAPAMSSEAPVASSSEAAPAASSSEAPPAASSSEAPAVSSVEAPASSAEMSSMDMSSMSSMAMSVEASSSAAQ